MTPLADMIEKMMADGVPMATILLAVRTAEQVAASGKSGGIPVDTTAEKRRAWDRARKANKPKSTGNSTGIPPEQSIALTSFLNSDPQEENKKEEKKEEAPRRKNGCVLPDDWRPKDDHYCEAFGDFQRSQPDVDRLAGEMRLWSKSNAHRAVARKSDWDLTFTGWMRREWGKSNGGQHGRAKQQSLGDFARDLAEQARSAERATGTLRSTDPIRGH